MTEATDHIDKSTLLWTAAHMFVIYLFMHGHAPLLAGIYKNYAGC